MENILKDELLALLEKARAGNATETDYSRIAAIINTDQTGELIVEADRFLAQEPPVPSQHIDPYNHEYWQRAFLEIKEAWQQQNGQPAKIRRLPAAARWWVAASVLLFVTAGAYFFLKPKSAKQAVTSTQILPGKDGAILTLADGSRILLDTILNGVVARQGGATAKIVNGTLLYEGRGTAGVYNTMSTPKARRFHVILPDGTKAWLNSASSIHYPTVFNGAERKVSVTGEVYFEVARNEKMPFRLTVNDHAEIEVLGTRFNVKAYDNESVINTTLLEGSIAIAVFPDKEAAAAKASKPDAAARFNNAGKFILKPGQQVQILVGEKKLLTNGDMIKDAAMNKAADQDTQRVMVINNTDVDKVMAWKNNVFDFNDIAFDDAMYQLERWYDIEVVYEKGVPVDIELSGKITKDVTLNDLVTILEKIGVKCRLEGRKLMIES